MKIDTKTEVVSSEGGCTSKEASMVVHWIEEAAAVARQATCRRGLCGAIIVSGEEVIGQGFNLPPGNDEQERRCHRHKSSYDLKITDKTCCVHAE